MDVVLLGSLSIILCFLIFVILQIIKLHRNEKESKNRIALLRTRAWGQEEENQEGEPARQQPRTPVVVGGSRRVAARRRHHMPNREEEPEEEVELGGGDSDEDDDGGRDYIDDIVLPEDGKIGKKKLAKLEAKAEKRAQREAELQEREERKKREAEREAKRKQEEEREKAEEAARLEAERKAKEEKERQEEEEYQKLKEAFSVEEEGFGEEESLESENLLQEFVNYIKKMKVVNMDELASHFKLKTPEVVDRIKTLVGDGTLTGVIDDRGKFIYITKEELLGVAKFINQRGRVSVQELAEYSNKLIRLEPEVSA